MRVMGESSESPYKGFDLVTGRVSIGVGGERMLVVSLHHGPDNPMHIEVTSLAGAPVEIRIPPTAVVTMERQASGVLHIRLDPRPRPGEKSAVADEPGERGRFIRKGGI